MDLDSDVLDLSGLELKELSSFTTHLAPHLTHVDLTQNRLSFFDPALLTLPNLKVLLLRQNLLTDASALLDVAAPGELEQLVLHDNQLTQLFALETFTKLRSLDVSFNQLRSMAATAGLSTAQPTELFFAANKITAIEGLHGLTALRSLELGSNRLRSMEGLSTLVALEELYVGRNKLSTLGGLEGLTNLRILSIQSNRITQLAGLETCVGLEELYLSHNGIEVMEGLSTLVNLNTLDITANKLTRVQGLGCNTRLEHLWLSDNQMADLDSLQEGLRPVRDTLNTIYLERNPGAAAAADYRATVLSAAPNLIQLDALLLKR